MEKMKIHGYEVRDDISRLAWKKLGYKNQNDLMEEAAALPPEKKMELLAQCFAKEIASQHLTNKIKFMETLGACTAVSPTEQYEWTTQTFSSDRFEVTRSDFYMWVAVDPTTFDTINRNHNPHKNINDRQE